MVNGKAQLENFIQVDTIQFADSDPSYYCNFLESSTALAIAMFLSSQPPETPSQGEDFALISPLFCSHHVFLVFLFFFRFRLQKYANAREAVHAISSEASWYYELPCFCSCIKNY